ncbi:MAG: hypothetical protein MK116_09655 [Phycisphaerales bacterium]|nr:hypothetical protein [Phycisphaerales bacterium]
MAKMMTTEGLGACLAVAALAMTATADETVTLMDQIGSDDGSAIATSRDYANQLFESNFAVYDIVATDNFDNSGAATVTSVEVVIKGWNGYNGLSGIQGLQVNFYNHYSEAAENNLLGYVTENIAGVPSGNGSWGLSGCDLIKATSDSGWALNSGTQYVAMVPFNEFSNNGQVSVLASTVGDGVAWQANPGFGFGQGAYWQIDDNLAFRVTGTSPDCNDNGTPDSDDIADGSSQDADGNGIPDECECPDVNSDGIVDVNDILSVLESWGGCPADGNCPGDVTLDGTVDVNDVLLVIGRWGNCG